MFPLSPPHKTAGIYQACAMAHAHGHCALKLRALFSFVEFANGRPHDLLAGAPADELPPDVLAQGHRLQLGQHDDVRW
jgi:hypothetical protein